jgi:hypothetical protein
MSSYSGSTIPYGPGMKVTPDSTDATTSPSRPGLTDPSLSQSRRMAGSVLANLLLAAVMLANSAPLLAAWQWISPPRNLSDSSQDARIPQIAGNQKGQAMAIWSRFNGVYWIAQAALYNGTTWDPVQPISFTDRDAIQPAVAIDASGQARAIWMATDRGNNAVYTARYRNGSWSEATRLSAEGINTRTPRIAMNGAGNAVATWIGYNGINWELQARLLMDGVWQAEVSLSAPGQLAATPQAVIDGNNVVTLAWSQFNGISNLVQSIRYRLGSWSAVTNISAVEQDTKLPQLVTDTAGNVTVVWLQANGTLFNVQGRHYNPSVGWDTITPVSSVSATCDTPQVTSHQSGGGAVAIWTQQNVSGLWTVRTRSFQNSSWGNIEAPNDSGQNAYTPKIATDNSGSYTAVWNRSNGYSQTVRGAHYKNGAWTPTKVLSKAGENAQFQEVAMIGGDRATVVWLRSNGEHQVVQAVQGNYAVDRYALTVNKSGAGTVSGNPAGIDCGVSCKAKFDSGTAVTLTATPAEGYTFTGWSGSCSGKAECVVKLTSDKTVAAKFVLSASYLLQINRSQLLGGLVTSSPEGIRCSQQEKACTFAYGKDAVVSLTATAEPGYLFKRWSDCPQADGAGCKVTLLKPKTTVMPRFEALPKYALQIKKTRNGSISSAPAGLNCGNNKTSCSAKFTTGTEIVLTATPASGMTFAGWSGDGCSGPVVTCRVLMDAKKKVKAVFE